MMELLLIKHVLYKVIELQLFLVYRDMLTKSLTKKNMKV